MDQTAEHDDACGAHGNGPRRVVARSPREVLTECCRWCQCGQVMSARRGGAPGRDLVERVTSRRDRHILHAALLACLGVGGQPGFADRWDLG